MKNPKIPHPDLCKEKIKQNQTLKTSVLSIASIEKVQQKFDSTHIQI